MSGEKNDPAFPKSVFHVSVQKLWQETVDARELFLGPKIKELPILPPMDRQDFADAVTEVIEWGLVSVEEIAVLDTFSVSQIMNWTVGKGVPEGPLKNSTLSLYYQTVMLALRKKKSVTVPLSA